MNEREQIISHCDAIIDTYHSGSHSIDNLIQMRRDLAVHLYRLSAHVKGVHGEAGLSYIKRKWAFAREVVAAQQNDAKLPSNKAEVRAESLTSTLDNRIAEVWAEAEREMLRIKIEGIKQVLMSMTQEISHESHEKKTTHYQSTGA